MRLSMEKYSWKKEYLSLLQVTAALLAILGGFPSRLFAGGVQTMHPVEVTDSAEDLVGTADSSTEGTITPQQLEERPFSRTGEVMEMIPGMPGPVPNTHGSIILISAR